jgi:hypothetical protein
MDRADMLRPPPKQPLPELLFELAVDMETHARGLLADARRMYHRSYLERSLDAMLALVRLGVENREYGYGQVLLTDAKRLHPDEPAERFVTVAPDVLGPHVGLDGDGDGDGDFAGAFVAISPEPERAAVALQRVAHRLMEVNEHGEVQTPADEERYEDAGQDPPYTPNYVGDATWNRYGAALGVDTNGFITAAMGRTMVAILVEALVEDGIAAHLTHDTADLREWESRPLPQDPTS